MGADSLGSLEQLLLLALARLPGNAYGTTIQQEIRNRTGRDVSLGAIYPTLDRLENKGYVSSHMGEPTSVRGGRSRRLYVLEQEGADALQQSRNMLTSMWAGLKLKPKPQS
jgi:DNA-binding PadR family transcriptional regulator